MVQRDRAEDCHGTGIVRLCQPVKGRVSEPKGQHTVVLILILPPLLLPLSCVSAPSLPKFPSSQPQAFHRGNISAETERSEEQVATGMFADRCFGERGFFAGLPHLRAR